MKHSVIRMRTTSSYDVIKGLGACTRYGNAVDSVETKTKEIPRPYPVITSTAILVCCVVGDDLLTFRENSNRLTAYLTRLAAELCH